MDSLEKLLTALSQSPFDLSIHAQHMHQAAQLEPSDLNAAREMLLAHFPAGDEVWLPVIKQKEEALDLDTAEGCLELLEVYNKAEEDYLSIPILQKHFEYLIERHAWLLESKADGFGELFSTEWTRSQLSAVVTKASSHMIKSHLLFDPYLEWELSLLDSASDKPALVTHIDTLLLSRLQQPHSTHEDTYTAYSSFTTAHQPPDAYEPLLVAASKLRAPAVRAYERREASEASLAQAGGSLAAYAWYIAAERRMKTLDLVVLRGVYERAIAEAASRRWVGEEGAEEMLRAFWVGYADVLRICGVHASVEGAVLGRAIKSVPGSGEVWARYIRFSERTNEEVESVAVAYDRALEINLFQKEVEQIVPIVLARAGYEKRLIEDENGDDDSFTKMINILQNGIVAVRKASPTGDPRLRLEKYLTDIYLDLDFGEQAIAVWQATAKHFKTSYLAWTSYTDILIRQHQHTVARSVFSDLVYKNLDWPEAIWEGWIAFEHKCGSVEELEACLDKVERARGQVGMRRAKEAEKAAYQQQAAVAAALPEPVTGEAMDVDAPVGGTKRKADAEDETPVAESSKKARIEQKPPPLKRDRENSTVFVADLPSGSTENELKELFKDCGKVREVKFTQLQGSLVATVEFFERDSVPAALTKDKKRVREEEIAVHLAWKSTLYVTNFPESADDSVIRDLFSQYGLIFDVRWPSKKFKNTRRFCYVQYTSPSSAEKALELQGRELEPDRPMSVLISNPERKKERTDADANEKEIYVAGLSKFTTKEDLTKLFKTYGPVKDVRMALEQNGQSKGFAFIEFDEEKDAQAAMGANNYELKKRRIAVTLADSRVRARNRGVLNETGLGRQAETRSRSVRVRNLPPATQEGLLQQVLEKHALVKRVEVFQDQNEAVVELENAAEAGKLLLRSEPILFNDKPLKLSEEAQGGASKSRAAAPPAKTGGLFVPRAATSRPRAGLGQSRKPGIGAGAKAAAASPPPAASGSQPSQGRGQDDFRKMLGGGH